MIRLLNSAARRARAKASADMGSKKPGSRKLSLTAARLRRCPSSYPGAPQPAAPSRAPPPSFIHFTIRTSHIAAGAHYRPAAMRCAVFMVVLSRPMLLFNSTAAPLFSLYLRSISLLCLTCRCSFLSGNRSCFRCRGI